MRKIDWKSIWAHMRAHIVWIVAWLVFYFVWGRLFWTTAEFGSQEWMRDNVGHALAGIIIAWQSIFEIRYFFPSWYLCWRSVTLYLVVPLIVMIAAVLWELGEMVRDLFDVSVQAQKGGPDTTLDIIITVFLGWITIGVYCLSDTWTDSGDDVKEQELVVRAEELRKERKLLNREIRSLRRFKLKQLPAKVREAFRDFLADDPE